MTGQQHSTTGAAPSRRLSTAMRVTIVITVVLVIVGVALIIFLTRETPVPGPVLPPEQASYEHSLVGTAQDPEPTGLFNAAPRLVWSVVEPTGLPVAQKRQLARIVLDAFNAPTFDDGPLRSSASPILLDQAALDRFSIAAYEGRLTYQALHATAGDFRNDVRYSVPNADPNDPVALAVNFRLVIDPDGPEGRQALIFTGPNAERLLNDVLPRDTVRALVSGDGMAKVVSYADVAQPMYPAP